MRVNFKFLKHDNNTLSDAYLEITLEAMASVLERGAQESLQYDWRQEEQLGGSSNNPGGV